VPILDGWNREIVKVLNEPEVRVQLEKHGLTPMPGTRDALARYIASESATWGKVVKDRKITAE
jgi:tripartite-type tricarboxylate transporter receptor subunit TctC